MNKEAPRNTYTVIAFYSPEGEFTSVSQYAQPVRARKVIESCQLSARKYKVVGEGMTLVDAAELVVQYRGKRYKPKATPKIKTREWVSEEGLAYVIRSTKVTFI